MESIAAGALDPVPRTFDEDELDAEGLPQFQAEPPVATWSAETPVKVDTLLFGVTAEASCFLKCVLPEDCNKCGVVESKGHGTWTLSLSKDGVMFALCEGGAVLPPEAAWMFLDALTEGVHFERAIILHSTHSAQFVAGNPYLVDDEEMSTLRHMKTEKFQMKKEFCPALEAPNVIDGFPAALMTHCQMTGKQAAMFICILTEREAGIDALKQWEPVLNLVGLEQKIATSVYEQNIKSTLIPAGHMVYT